MRVDPIDRLVRPLERFMKNQAAGGVLLFGAAIVALIWANSPFRESYHHLWEHTVAISIDDWKLERTLHHWINDGLMAMFFFVVGLELKREIVGGELAEPAKAILPVAAGVGGMLFPALVYLAMNGFSGPAVDGWGIPMATDIAFAVGIIALLGSRIPMSLKVFLITLAIADDLGAVLVIALFYTSDISMVNLAIGAVFMAILVAGNLLGVRNPIFYAVFGVGGLWTAFMLSGVHATVAGVLAAVTIPASTMVDEQGYLERMRRYLREFSLLKPNTVKTLTEEQLHAIDKMVRLNEQASTPLQRLEHRLHPFVAFLVMPLFALANAGVELPSDLGAVFTAIPSGTALGLLIGKPIGILLVCWILLKLNIAQLGYGITWHHLIGMGFLAGIGFTMSLFINELAFSDPVMRQEAKLGILLGSLLAGTIGYFILRSSPAVPSLPSEDLAVEPKEPEF
jgi:NhaA family Na+:H+ antiporter